MLPLLRPAPDLLVVQGDTSSALGGALAGALAEVPVAHVEAGLRTHDPRLPWPEEEYRTAIDARADLLFAPTERAVANLRQRGPPGRSAHDWQHRHRRIDRHAGAASPARAGARRWAAHSGHLPSSRKLERRAQVDRGRAHRDRARLQRADRLRPSSEPARSGDDAAVARFHSRNIADPAMHPERARAADARRPTWCSATRAGSRKKPRHSALRFSCCAKRPNGPRWSPPAMPGSSELPRSGSSPRSGGCSQVRPSCWRWRCPLSPSATARPLLKSPEIIKQWLEVRKDLRQ